MQNLRDHEWLYVARRMAGLSQAQLARRLMVHQTTISKMEKGKLKFGDALRTNVPLMSTPIPQGLRASVLRRRLKLKISDVAKKLGVHDHRVGEMEHGARPVSDEYWKLLNGRGSL